MKKVFTIGRYFRRKFGEDVYKVPLSIAGFTCPNIDGTVAKGGCTFCLNESFSPNLAEKTSKKFYLHPDRPENPLLQKQLEQVRWQYGATSARLRGKYGVKKFLAYFQSFTNTYAPIDTLKALYEEALRQPGCVGLSIGTRSDSVSDEILDYLAELSQKYEGKIKVYKVNTEKNRELASAFQITSIPRILFVPLKGQPTMVVGGRSKAFFEEQFAKLLNEKSEK